MTIIRVRFNPPNGPTEGRIRLTPRHDTDNRPLVVGQDIISGDTGWLNVPVEGREIDVRPSEPGWHYVIQGKASGAPSFNTTVLVPADGPVNFEDLVRYDPKAGLAYEPDPAWWAWVKRLEDLKGVPGEDGEDGESAYELAVRNGYTGTEQAWLDSLKGADGESIQGPRGKTAYQVALDNGFEGSEQDWLATLEGPEGPPGPGATDEDIAEYVAEGTVTGDVLRATFSLRDAVDARLYGLTEGTHDSAPALNAAADAARDADAPLYIPSGRYEIDSTVNLRYLSVHCAGTIVVRHENAIGVIIGHSAQFRPQLDINIREVVHSNYSTAQVDKAYPAIRMVGLKGSEVRIGRSSFLELYADDKVFEDNSLAYNTFRFGRINVLRINGVDTYSWINENLSLGGSFAQIHIEGLYPHNNNLWLKAAIEGPASSNPGIFISKGTHNQFQSTRAEGAVSFAFTGDASNNKVNLLWGQHPDITGPTPAVTDVAGNNIVTTEFSESHSVHTIARIDADTMIGTNTSEIRGMARFPTQSSTFKKLEVPTGWGILADFTIPIEDELASAASANQTQFPRSRMLSFIIRSDVSFLRPRVFGLDVDGNTIDAAVTPFLSGWGITVVSNYYSKSSTSSFMPVRVTNPNVKYLRFMIYNDGAATFKHVTLSAYLPVGQHHGIVDQARRAAHNRALPS